VTDRDGMYVHVTAKGAMSFRMDCQPMSWLRSTMQPSRPSRNGHPISTAFRFRSGAKDPERNTLRNAVINWPDGDEGEKSHFRDGSFASFLTYLQHVRYPAHLRPAIRRCDLNGGFKPTSLSQFLLNPKDAPESASLTRVKHLQLGNAIVGDLGHSVNLLMLRSLRNLLRHCQLRPSGVRDSV
jgi:hypothetical protein